MHTHHTLHETVLPTGPRTSYGQSILLGAGLALVTLGWVGRNLPVGLGKPDRWHVLKCMCVYAVLLKAAQHLATVTSIVYIDNTP